MIAAGINDRLQRKLDLGLSLILRKRKVRLGRAALGFCGRDGVRPTRRPHANGRAARVHGTLGRRVLTRPAASQRGREASSPPVAGPFSASLATGRRRPVRSATPPRSRPPLHPHAELDFSPACARHNRVGRGRGRVGREVVASRLLVASGSKALELVKLELVKEAPMHASV